MKASIKILDKEDNGETWYCEPMNDYKQKYLRDEFHRTFFFCNDFP